MCFLYFQALKQLPREKVQLATKFGVRFTPDRMKAFVNGTPEYVRECCEASLKRLGVDYIDLYFQHRVDTTVPIENTVSFGKSCSILLSIYLHVSRHSYVLSSYPNLYELILARWGNSGS